jgi:hypothetical protein
MKPERSTSMRQLRVPVLALLVILSVSGTALVCCGTGGEQPKSDLRISEIRLPEGFTIELYAEDVPNARSVALSAGGILFVGNRAGDKVFAVVDRDRDYRADKVHGEVRSSTAQAGRSSSDA